MNHRTLRLGRLVALSAAAAVLATLAVMDASAAVVKPVKPNSCPTNKPLVVDGYANYTNDFDYGADGHVWAIDNYTNFIQIRRVADDTYCFTIHSVGTSTTIGGLSPEGTGSVRAGVTATFDGTIYRSVEGKFEPTSLPTSGLIGNFDYGCQPDGVTCSGPGSPGIAGWFSKVSRSQWGAYDFTANAGPECGVWHQSSSGDTGDIVC
jgi:hypothetical protein